MFRTSKLTIYKGKKPQKKAPQLSFILFFVLIFFISACRAQEPSSPSENLLTPPDLFKNPSSQQDATKKLSAGQSLKFVNFSLEDGLSQSTVFSSIQDRDGYLWFGTEDGLNKFDGYSFTVFKSDPDNIESLSSNWIQVVFEDADGVIWLGTSNGLNRLNPDRETFTHYQNDPEDSQSISGDFITSIYQDQQGILWIGTDDGGINSFDPQSDIFHAYQFDPGDRGSIGSGAVKSIYEDQYGLLWVGTSTGGLNLLNRNENSWYRFMPDTDNPTSLSHENVTAITGDDAGNLWIGTDGGGLIKLVLTDTQIENFQNGKYATAPVLRFFHYSHNPDNSGSLSSNDITSIFLDQEGLLWIGTRTTGLNIFLPAKELFRNFQHNHVYPDSLSNNWILSILKDREGNYWFGTIGGGISMLNQGWRNFPLYRNIPADPNSLGDEMVRSFYQDIESLWVGTMFGGLDRMDRITGDWIHYTHDPAEILSLGSNFISALYQDQSGILWIGTSSSLDRLDPNNGEITHHQPFPGAPSESVENNIRAIYENPPGQLWVGTMGGLFFYDQNLETWSQLNYHDVQDPHNPDSVWILSIIEDHEGFVWVATWDSGVFKIDPITKEIQHYHADPEDPTSLSSNNILSIHQDNSGVMWFSTTRGLNKFDPATEEFTHYLEKDGLPNDTIYCTLEDPSGHLWISTNQGLARFDPHNEIFSVYDVDDGLQSNEFNGNACYKGIDGELIFGGIRGFNIINPHQIQTNPYQPPIVITSFKSNGNNGNIPYNIQRLNEIKLDWQNNAFEFEYAALSFNQPEKNQYAYYLDGFEEDWNFVGSRRYGQYTNLPGGTYTLRIKGSNNDGVWNELGTSIEVTVVPPFWGTWWFRGLVLAAVIGTSYGGFKLRVRNLEKRSRELENQVKDRTDKLMEAQLALKETDLQRAVVEERNRLARELHDSVTQSLYSLTLFTEAARHLAEEAGTDKLEGYLGQIGNLGLQALKEMRLLVFELRLHALEDDGLVEALEKRLVAVEGRTGVDARVINENLEKQSPFIETQLFHIAQEALNNALKHAEASTVEVKFRQDGSLVELEITDDGIGFEPESLAGSPGMGLKNIQERVERMGGRLEIDTKLEKGTRLSVSIKTDGPIL